MAEKGSITAEAIQEIERLTNETKRVGFCRPDGLPKHLVYQTGPEAQCELVEVPIGPHNITLETPDEFVAFVTAHTEPAGPGGRQTAPRVFYTANGLDFIFDLNAPRQDHARCPMPFTAEFTWLRDKSGAMLNQKAFVRLLRIDLRRCFTDSNLLALVRNLKWKVGADTAGDVQHGRESLGRAIQAEVRGESSIPEDIFLSVPIWENFRFATTVTCAVEIFPAEEVFKLTPLPGSMERALDDGLDAIRELFESEDKFPPFFRGKR